MARDQKSWILRGAIAVAVLALLGASMAPQATAEPWRGRGAWERGRPGHEVPHWGHGDISRFHERDLGQWRGGHWFHGRHSGRLGWWWIVGGVWFFYPVPVYPYPDPYVPPTVVAPPPPAQSPAQYWYYCASAQAYYPYVTGCPEGWMQVVPRLTPPGQ